MISRRDFFKLSAVAGMSFAMGRTVRSVQSIQKADVVLVKSEDRVKAIEKAIDLTGLNLSMERTW